MKLTVIHPVVGTEDAYLRSVMAYAKSLVQPDTELEFVSVKAGFPTIESDLHGLFNGPGVLRAAVEAAKKGADGVFVNCFDDPGVAACREVLSIPVFGAYLPAMLTALSLGELVGVVTTDDAGVVHELQKARALGVDSRLAGVRPAETDVSGAIHDEGIPSRLTESCLRLWREDRAGCAVLGCTGMQHAAATVREALLAVDCPLQLVEPFAAGISWLERCCRLGYSNSLHLGLTLDSLKGM